MHEQQLEALLLNFQEFLLWLEQEDVIEILEFTEAEQESLYEELNKVMTNKDLNEITQKTIKRFIEKYEKKINEFINWLKTENTTQILGQETTGIFIESASKILTSLPQGPSENIFLETAKAARKMQTYIIKTKYQISEILEKKKKNTEDELQKITEYINLSENFNQELQRKQSETELEEKFTKLQQDLTTNKIIWINTLKNDINLILQGKLIDGPDKEKKQFQKQKQIIKRYLRFLRSKRALPENLKNLNKLDEIKKYVDGLLLSWGEKLSYISPEEFTGLKELFQIDKPELKTISKILQKGNDYFANIINTKKLDPTHQIDKKDVYEKYSKILNIIEKLKNTLEPDDQKIVEQLTRPLKQNMAEIKKFILIDSHMQKEWELENFKEFFQEKNHSSSTPMYDKEVQKKCPENDLLPSKKSQRSPNAPGFRKK